MMLSTSLKPAALAQARGLPAQANSSRLGEISSRGHFKFSLKIGHLAQARGLHLGDNSNKGGGEPLLFSLRRELLT
ncbi:hypothetical protein DEO72_LG8g2492 [Vigna unguiculata]|uniref:Uncharacterized protein n=1 Tax=Vigna unguiculata TaxID=3917 RepID=A0A4D6MSL3_VIGUN|nr:hypothetical protein DEO72_LG8g2492 [Vigna unguiculata]